MHKEWAAEQQERERNSAEYRQHAEASTTPNQQIDYITSREDRRQPLHRVSNSTNSTATGSTSSSFLSSNFAKRYFVLKSLSEEDLALSVKNCLWATQSHNEPVLDQAYRTSREGVFLIFSANKSGEFFGFAKMAGSISKLPTSSMTTKKSSSSEGTKDSSSSLRATNMTIMEEGEAFMSPGIFSPSAPQTDSPQPETPGRERSASRDSQHPAIAAIKRGVSAPIGGRIEIPQSGALAPRPAQSLVDAKRQEEEETETLAERRGADLEIEGLLLGKGGIRDLAITSQEEQERRLQQHGQVLSNDSSQEEQQQSLGATSHPAQEEDEDGVIRKDTLITPEERNAKLEQMEESLPGGTEKRDNSGSSIFDKGWGRPFPIEWIKVQRLPFHRTRHLKNAFNQNREVKISRDGTELDPSTGEQLVQEFFRLAAPESPYPDIQG